jgi:hypothetical protein
MAYDEEIRMLSRDGAFSPQALEVIRVSLKDLGILEQVPDASALYDPSFTPVKF